MIHVILTGATGLVGCIALDMMLHDDAVDKITILSRKPVPQADGHAKAQVIIHEDLAVYSDEVLASLKGAHACIWTVSPPYMSVTKKYGLVDSSPAATRNTDGLGAREYEYGHIQFPVIAAKVYATLSDHFNFVYFSPVRWPSALTLCVDDLCDENSNYIRTVKRRAEDALYQLHHDPSKGFCPTKHGKAEETQCKETALPSLNVYCVRPMGIDYRIHKGIHPYIKRPLPLAKKISNWIVIPIARLVNWQYLGTSEDLGRVLVDLAVGNGRDLEVDNTSRGGRSIGVLGMKAWVKNRDEHVGRLHEQAEDDGVETAA